MSSAPWRASGLVTLLTDFGHVDPYVGVLKGVLWGAARGLRAVVDLTHEVPPQDVARAAFFLERARAFFPAGTVHVAVVDPGVGSQRDILLVESGGSAFLAPDNGLCDPILARDAEACVHVPDLARLGLERGSRTFHGRDRFAPLAARLVDGTPPQALGAPRAPRPPRLVQPSPTQSGGVLRAEVLFADRFGNLITNAGAADLCARLGSVVIGGRTARPVETYAEGGPGELVCLLDSYDLFELAVNGGSAALELGVGAGAVVEFREEPTR